MKSPNTLNSKELALCIAKLCEDKKGSDTELLDISEISDLADYIIISSGESSSQLKAMARHVEESLTETGLEPNLKEGKYGDKWYLLDYGNVIVNIIQSEARLYYNLEELWQHAHFIPASEWEE
ncbi:MAG: ribosome silencing factor [Candidatus Melainabacteria bacterium]|nr:ribosome silencing factor [Candidatus Melainabacteria bacterium]